MVRPCTRDKTVCPSGSFHLKQAGLNIQWLFVPFLGSPFRSKTRAWGKWTPDCKRPYYLESRQNKLVLHYDPSPDSRDPKVEAPSFRPPTWPRQRCTRVVSLVNCVTGDRRRRGVFPAFLETTLYIVLFHPTWVFRGDLRLEEELSLWMFSRSFSSSLPTNCWGTASQDPNSTGDDDTLGRCCDLDLLVRNFRLTLWMIDTLNQWLGDTESRSWHP